MKHALLKFLVCAALVGLAACGGATANLQVFNGSPDAPPIDLLFNDQVMVTGLAGYDFSQYQEVDAGSQTLRVNESGTSRTLAEQNAQLNSKADYTLIVLNFLNKLEILFLTDDNTIDLPSTAKVRLVNGAPSAPNLDFYFTSPDADLNAVNPLLTDIAFKGVSNYQVLGSATYRVRVTQAGTKTVLVDSGNFLLSPSQVRTGVVVDSEGGGPPFNIVFLPDKL